MPVFHHSYVLSRIPLDGLLDAVCKFCFRQPAELVVNLCRVNRVAHVMAFAVGHVGDQAFRLAKLLADDLYDIDVLHLVVSADVVDFADTTLVDDQVNGTAVIFDVQPVTYIFTLPYTGSGLSFSAFAIISGISFSGK